MGKSKKINIKSIIDDLQIQDFNIIDGQNISWESSKTSSSHKFEQSLQMAINTFAAVIFVTAVSYYILEKQKLSGETNDQIKRFVDAKIKQMKSAKIPKPITKIVLAWKEKFIKLDETKHKYFNIKHVIKDDAGATHGGAFNAKNAPNKVPKKNILIKFTYDRVHIRCGIKMSTESQSWKIKIINFCKKKDC